MDNKKILRYALLIFVLILAIVYAQYPARREMKVAVTQTTPTPEPTLTKDQQEQINSVNEYLMNDYYPSLAKSSSCLQTAPACNRENSEFNSRFLDLNDDGVQEQIIMPWRVCGCPMRGASGNGDILLVSTQDNNPWVIGNLSGNGLTPSGGKTNGYADIVTNFHGSASSGTQTLYKFSLSQDGAHSDGYTEMLSQQYEFNKSTGYNKKDFGEVEGTLYYPSSYIPEDILACAEDINTKQLYCTSQRFIDSKFKTGIGYRLFIPTGRYLVFAKQSKGKLNGAGFDENYRAYYSEFMTCGMGISCASHNPIPIIVVTGKITTNIDPGDWYK